MQTAQSESRPWTAGVLVLAGLFVLAAILVTRYAWLDIWRIAMRDEEASQVYLTPVVVVWMLWAYREYMSALRARASAAGPVIILFGWGILTYGFNHQVQAFLHGGALLVVIGALLSVVGLDVLRRFWPVFIVLGFLIPVPGMLRQQIALPMQNITAQISGFICDLVGMDVERSGSVLIYNDVSVAVAEACNGMRMVFALVLVSFAFAFATPLNSWVRVMIIALSPLSAVLCNVIRLVPTVYVYGNYSPEFAEHFHDLTGWVMLVVALLLLMGLVRLLEWLQFPVAPREIDDSDADTSPPVAKVVGEAT